LDQAARCAGEADFTVSVRSFKGKQEGGKQLHNVTATAAW
jgi:hypothetical protein